MKLSVVQFTPGLFEIESNYSRIAALIGQTDSDMIVFPELSTSGYFFLNRPEVEKAAETFGKGITAEIQKISSNSGKIIILGFPELSNNKIYNSAAIIFPERNLSCVYRKTHLFYRERFYFDRGDTGFFVIDYKPLDLKIGAMICYDWRFPEAARTLGLLGADLIVVPANLITGLWTKVMPARAIENKLYFAIANRCGCEERNGEKLLFNGKSGIWDYNGDLIAGAGAEYDMVLTVEINPAETRDKSFNEFNDIFKDRIPELYRI